MSFAAIAAAMLADGENEYQNGYDDGLAGLEYTPTLFSMDMDDNYRRGYEDGEAERHARQDR